MWNFRVLVSLLLFYMTIVNCDDFYPPAIALYPKKTIMVLDSNMTEWKPLTFNINVNNLKHANIAEYCKKSFPDLKITNYFQSKDQVTIKNWCTEGKSVNCKGHAHKVFPYFCVDKNFKGLQITAQKGCTMHVKGKKSDGSGHNKEKCYDQKDWYSVGLAACKDTNSKLTNHTVMKPCNKPGYFEAFQFVCCPKTSEKVTESPTQVPIKNEETDKCMMPKEVGWCRASIHRWYFDAEEKRCKIFVYGGCHGNENNFETEEDCLNQCKCHLEKRTGMCRGFFMRWHYNKAAEKCQEFVYGGCDGNPNRFENEQSCMNNCSVIQTIDEEFTTTVESEVVSNEEPKVTNYEITISETENDDDNAVDVMFNHPYLSTSFLNELKSYNQNYNKDRLVETENFNMLTQNEKFTLSSGQHIEHVRNLHNIERKYLSKSENLLNNLRTETYDKFLDKSSSVSDLSSEEVFQSLMAYVATEKYEQQYCLDHHKTVFDDFKKHARIEAVKDTNSVILSLQESIYSVQNRLRKNLQSVDDRIKNQFSEQIEKILNDFQPIDLKYVTYQSIDNLESSADLIDDTEYEVENGNDNESEEFDIPDIAKTYSDEESEYDDTESEYALKSSSWWLFWGGLLCVTLLIAVLAANMAFKSKNEKKLKKSNKKVTKNNQIFTPEEKQLLQMQQDGFENPTYKFFEKHQKA